MFSFDCSWPKPFNILIGLLDNNHTKLSGHFLNARTNLLCYGLVFVCSLFANFTPIRLYCDSVTELFIALYFLTGDDRK
jgi:hypothetical protein